MSLLSLLINVIHSYPVKVLISFQKYKGYTQNTYVLYSVLLAWLFSDIFVYTSEIFHYLRWTQIHGLQFEKLSFCWRINCLLKLLTLPVNCVYLQVISWHTAYLFGRHWGEYNAIFAAPFTITSNSDQFSRSVLQYLTRLLRRQKSWSCHRLTRLLTVVHNAD